MKNDFKTIIYLMLLSTLSFTATANKKTNDSLPDLEIKGKISKNGKAKGTYKVELLYKNIVIDTKEVRDEKAFSFTMPSQRDYIIKIYKKGYSTKVIGINKGLHRYSYSQRFYKYEFTTKMEEALYGTIEPDSMQNGSNGKKVNDKERVFNSKRKYGKKYGLLSF